MQKLFLDYTPENEIILDGEEARHIAKSLRMKVGDMLTVTDGNGNDFGCQIETVTKDTVTLKVCYRQANNSEPTCKVTIYQGVPKSTKLEDIVQKCVNSAFIRLCPRSPSVVSADPTKKAPQRKISAIKKSRLRRHSKAAEALFPKLCR